MPVSPILSIVRMAYGKKFACERARKQPDPLPKNQNTIQNTVRTIILSTYVLSIDHTNLRKL